MTAIRKVSYHGCLPLMWPWLLVCDQLGRYSKTRPAKETHTHTNTRDSPSTILHNDSFQVKASEANHFLLAKTERSLKPSRLLGRDTPFRLWLNALLKLKIRRLLGRMTRLVPGSGWTYGRMSVSEDCLAASLFPGSGWSCSPMSRSEDCLVGSLVPGFG